MTPDPLTIKSIQLQPINDFGPVYSCGCELLRQNGNLRLCQYHEGYDDGVEAARRAMIPPVAFMIGTIPILHGERGDDIDPEHPEWCLCGQYENYWLCPEWSAPFWNSDDGTEDGES